MKGKLIGIGIVAAIAAAAYFGVTSAMSSKAILLDSDVTLNVTKMWIDTEPADKKTYYLVAGDEIVNGTNTGVRKVIEIESPLGMIWASNPDNDWARIDEGKTYTFKCTGYEIALTRDNLVCRLT